MLQQQILKTLKYFDVQDKPLTLLEIHKYLLPGGEPAHSAVQAASAKAPRSQIGDISRALSQMNHEVGSDRGFYFLRGREKLAKQRLENNFYASARQNLIRKYLPGTRWVPFVRAVAVTGSEALSNSKQGSDIDLFILTAPNRIWLARLCLTIHLHIRGVRRHGDKIENRFCLNHYVEEGKVIGDDRNIYTAVEYVSLQPAWGADKIFEFQRNNLDWIGEYLAQPQILEWPAAGTPSLKKLGEKFFANPLGDWLERTAGVLQKRRIKVKEHILVADDELSFHPGSKGKQVLSKVEPW